MKNSDFVVLLLTTLIIILTGAFMEVVEREESYDRHYQQEDMK